MGLFKFGYKKVSANEALVITGSGIGKDGDPGVYNKNGRMIRIVRGGSVLVTPLQIAEPISLNSFQIKLTTPRIVTNEGVPIRAWATATIKIADELEAIVNYAEQFLGKERSVIKDEIRFVLEGNLRTIVAKLTALEVNNAREQFMQQVREIAQKELTNMGFHIVSLVLDDVKDDDEEKGYLINLGAKTIAESHRSAEIARSDAALEIANKLAENRLAAQQKEDNTAILTNESEKSRQLKEVENLRELELERFQNEQAIKLKQTEIDKSLKAAQLEAERFEQEGILALNLKKTENEKSLKAAEIEAKKVEQEGLLAIKETERQIKEKEALIIAQNEKIKANTIADIEVINAQAEAKVFEVNALAKAAAIEAEGKAKAESVRLLGLAEAEAIEKKAEAMQKYGQASVLEMLIGVLPQMAESISKPLAAISEVKVMEFGGNGNGESNGVQSIASNTVGVMGIVQDMLRETTGIDMKGLLESNASLGRNQLVQQEMVVNDVAHVQQNDTKEQLAAVNLTALNLPEEMTQDSDDVIGDDEIHADNPSDEEY